MITAIVLTHNEEEMLLNCLKSIEWVDEILISDKKSTDSTLAIAQKYNAKIHHFTGVHFDDWRNQALEKTNGNWAIYIDPDERITKELKAEIQTILNKNETSFVKSDLKSAYRMKRINYWWGREFFSISSIFVSAKLFSDKTISSWLYILLALKIASSMFSASISIIRESVSCISISHGFFINDNLACFLNL